MGVVKTVYDDLPGELYTQNAGYSFSFFFSFCQMIRRETIELPDIRVRHLSFNRRTSVSLVLILQMMIIYIIVSHLILH